jgi:hypothetical protein
VPFVLEVVVDGKRSAPTGVGREVDCVFFHDRGKLLFNASFACGKPQGLCRRSSTASRAAIGATSSSAATRSTSRRALGSGR